MKRTILVAGLLAAFMVAANGQGVPNSSTVVSSCGTPPATYTPGQNKPNLQDTNGRQCSNATTSIVPAASTPVAGNAFTIVTGGVAVTLISAPLNGCYIVNPASATDQGIVTAEVAYINGVTTATTTGDNTTVPIQPGQSWSCVPGQTTNVSGNAATSGHRLSVIKW